VKATDILSATTGDLVGAYAAAAREHAAASASGRHRVANRNVELLTAIYRELRSRGPAAQTALLSLLTQGQPGVRGSAAAHALEFAPARAGPVLEELARGARRDR
jgi:hypothetical protein